VRSLPSEAREWPLPSIQSISEIYKEISSRALARQDVSVRGKFSSFAILSLGAALSAIANRGCRTASKGYSSAQPRNARRACCRRGYPKTTGRRQSFTQHFQTVKTVAFRHLHSQEDQIRALPRISAQCSAPEPHSLRFDPRSQTQIDGNLPRARGSSSTISVVF